MSGANDGPRRANYSPASFLEAVDADREDQQGSELADSLVADFFEAAERSGGEVVDTGAAGTKGDVKRVYKEERPIAPDSKGEF